MNRGEGQFELSCFSTAQSVCSKQQVTERLLIIAVNKKIWACHQCCKKQLLFAEMLSINTELVILVRNLSYCICLIYPCPKVGKGCIFSSAVELSSFSTSELLYLYHDIANNSQLKHKDDHMHETPLINFHHCQTIMKRLQYFNFSAKSRPLILSSHMPSVKPSKQQKLSYPLRKNLAE